MVTRLTRVCTGLGFFLLGFVTISSAGPIHDAAEAGDLMKVKELLNADPNLISEKGGKIQATPLHCAAAAGQVKVAEFLLSKGAHVDIKTPGNWTPLHLAALLGHKEVFKFLLSRGADPNAKTVQGWSADDIANKYGPNEVSILLLLKKAAEIQLARNKEDEKKNVTVGEKERAKKESARKSQTKVFETSEMISDAAALQVILLDLRHNLLGLGWEDRERLKLGKTKLIEIILKTAAKYEIDLRNIDFSYESTLRGSGNLTAVPVVSVNLPATWCEVVKLNEVGRLPTVKFRKGIIRMESWDVQFDDQTECIVGGQHYVYYNGKWLAK